MAEERKTVIHLENIYKRFYIGKPNELEILHGVSIDVKEGEFVSIVGTSGDCGIIVTGRTNLVKSRVCEA